MSLMKRPPVNQLLKQASKFLDKDQYDVFKLLFACNAF